MANEGKKMYFWQSMRALNVLIAIFEGCGKAKGLQIKECRNQCVNIYFYIEDVPVCHSYNQTKKKNLCEKCPRIQTHLSLKIAKQRAQEQTNIASITRTE